MAGVSPHHLTNVVRAPLPAAVAQLRLALDCALDAILLFEAASLRILHANRAAAELVGRTAPDLKGMSVPALVEGWAGSAAGERLNPLIAGETDTVTWGARVRHRSGRLIPVEAVVRYQEAPDGEAFFAVALRDCAGHIPLDPHEAEVAWGKAMAVNRRLVGSVLAIQEQERRRLANDLHDELGQALTAIKIDAEFIRARVAGGDGEVEGVAGAIVALAQDTIGRVRSITRQLRPVTLDRLGLRDAITETVKEWALRHPGIHCDLRVTGAFDALDWSQGIAFFRVLQESLTNVSRHAGATRVWVSLVAEEVMREAGGAGPVTLVVEDDGCGLSGHPGDGGLGLITMRERMGACGGGLEIARGEAGGVRVVARLQRP